MEKIIYNEENFPIGVDEVAKILGVKSATVSTWKSRKAMPPADALLNKGRTRLWSIKTIIDWANATGRNPMNISYEQAHFIVGVVEEKSSPQIARWEQLAENWEKYKDYNPFTEDNWDDLGKVDDK